MSKGDDIDAIIQGGVVWGRGSSDNSGKDGKVRTKAKKKGYKELWVVPGAVHANSYAKYPKEYEAHVQNFLDMVKGM